VPSSVQRLKWFLIAGPLLLSSAAVSQVQVNQNFVSQGPAPIFGPTDISRSADAPPNGNLSGAVGPVVADPLNANTFYIGTVSGGIWKTTNGGAIWTPLTDNQATLSISSLALDPTDPNRNTLIAGTGLTSNGTVCLLGPCFFTGTGGLQNGLLYSKDGGSSWTSLGAATLNGQSVDAVAARGNVILAGTFEQSFAADANQRRVGGLYRSSDGGATFALVSGTGGLPTGPVTSIVGDPNNSNRLYAAVSSPNAGTNVQTALFVSNNAGATWTQVFGAAQTGTILPASQTVLKVASGPGGALAVGVVDLATRTVTGLFWSGNSGANWTSLTVPTPLNPGMQVPINFAITIDPSNPNLVYVSGDRIVNAPFTVTAFRIDAINSPNIFTSITDANTANNSSVHADSRALTFDANGRLVLTNDAGIYARTSPQNDTGAWTSLTGNLALLQPYSVAYDAVGKRLIAAAQDNGVAIQSGRNQLLWNATNTSDGINAFVNDVTLAGAGLTAFYQTNLALTGISRIVMDAHGKIISPQTAGSEVLGAAITCNGGNCDNAQVVGVWDGSPWVNNRIDTTRMALGGSHVYVTHDTLTGAQSPSATTVDLKLTDVGNAVGPVSKIAYGTRDNPNMLVAGGFNGLFQSTTATANSLAPVPSYMAAGGSPPTGIVLDPRSQFRYFVADNLNLFSTTTQGSAFTNVTGNLPAGIIKPTALEFISNNGVNALLVGGLNSVANVQSPIAAADSDGVGTLSNWRAFGTGLPNSQISALFYNSVVDVLAVGTFGRGAFTLYDVTSYFPQATVLQFGLADNDSLPDASFLTNGTVGNRSLIKYGSGILMIAGDATYTGGTSINGGAVVLGTGGTAGSILGDVAFCSNAADPRCDPSNNKSLAFNRSDTYTFGGSITGPGQVFQIGSGKTVLTGNSTYSGPTFVNNGTLSVNGSITSPVFVNFGGTLGGNGSVGSTTILAAGTLSPGNSVGTITINGNLVFVPGSLYLAEVFANTADRSNVTGSATLAGTVAAVNTGGNLTNSYTIISTAGGVIGTFDALSPFGFPGFLSASLAYTPTTVLLNLNSQIIHTPGLTQNLAAVAAALDGSFNNGRGTLPGLFGLSTSQLPAALDALSGEGISGTQETAFGADRMFISLMMDQGAFWRNGETIDPNGITYGAAPVQDASSKPSKKSKQPVYKALVKAPSIYQPRWRAWATGFDSSWKLNGEAGIGSASLSHKTGGLAGGLDYQFAPDVLAGFAMGGSTSTFSVPSRITSGQLEGGHFGGYGVKTWGSLYAAGAVSFSTFRNSTNRMIAEVGPTEVATGDFGSNLWSGRLEVGSKQVLGWLGVTPFAAVQVSKLWQNGFTETNAPPPGAGVLGLTENSLAVSSMPTFVGAQFDGRFYLPGGIIVSPYARLSWVHEFNTTRNITASFIALPGTLFTVDGPHAARDSGRVEVGAKLALTQTVKAFASFDGEFSSRAQVYAGKGGVIVAW
jgi:autotransporter-associated beta strand protein